VIVISFPSFADSIHKKTGTSSAQFLKVDIGARAIAMGEAFTAISDDANSIFWNPAGLYQIKQPEASFTYNRWLADITQGTIVYAQPLGIGAAGCSLVYFNMGELTGRDDTGERIPNFTAYDVEALFSYSYPFSNILSCGMNLKIIQEKIEDEKANATAVDLGGLYRTPVENLTTSLVFQNIGTEMEFIAKTYSLPAVLKIGLGYHIFDKRLGFALDLIKPKDNKFQSNFGAEYRVKEKLFLRAGYRSLSDYGTGFSAGIGLSIAEWIVDYAYLPCNRLENVHQVTLSVRFAKSPEKRVK